ncbi:MAG: MFS transporter [Candidatus Pacebacteria bacterium]|nr:MFS transporter [Candidatus Paceibacterota bacterium]
MHSILKNRLLLVTYLMTFLYALHYAIPVYATSSYLHKFFSSSTVSAAYVIGSLFALFASIHIAKSIKKYHTYRFTMGVALLEIAVIALFGLTEVTELLLPLFIIHFALQALLFVSLNVFMESFSAHANVGSIRGLFLAVLHVGILVSPIIGGYILAVSSFAVLYCVSALVLIPYLFLVHHYLGHIKDPAYHTVNLFDALRKALKNKNLRAAVIAKFLVECFYAVMVIYSPLYLATLGIPLTTYLGFIIPIALIPLVVLPYELGFLADTKYGEKEMLLIGLLLLTVTTFICVLLTTSSILIWALVLLVSRIGASLVDTMAYTYYFKKIGPEDPSFTALFINMTSVGVIATGAVGVGISPFLVERPQLMFVILGCAIAWGVTVVLPMKDTR